MLAFYVVQLMIVDMYLSKKTIASSYTLSMYRIETAHTLILFHRLNNVLQIIYTLYINPDEVSIS